MIGIPDGEDVPTLIDVSGPEEMADIVLAIAAGDFTRANWMARRVRIRLRRKRAIHNARSLLARAFAAIRFLLFRR